MLSTRSWLKKNISEEFKIESIEVSLPAEHPEAAAEYASDDLNQGSFQESNTMGVIIMDSSVKRYSYRGNIQTIPDATFRRQWC